MVRDASRGRGRRQGGGDVVKGAGTSSRGRGRHQGSGDVTDSDVMNCYNLLAERCFCYNAVE